MATEPSIFNERRGIGSVDELDEYGVWVKSEPEDIFDDDSDSPFPGEDLSKYNSDDFSFDDLDNENHDKKDDFLDEGLDDASFDAEYEDEPLKKQDDELPAYDINELLPDNGAVESVGKKAEGGMDSVSTELLLKIANELSSIKTELSTLKQELSSIRDRSDTEDTESVEDETIALTGDELADIMNDATIEVADESSEAPFEDVLTVDKILNDDSADENLSFDTEMNGDDFDDGGETLSDDEIKNILNNADIVHEGAPEDDADAPEASDKVLTDANFGKNENGDFGSLLHGESFSNDTVDLDFDTNLDDDATAGDNAGQFNALDLSESENLEIPDLSNNLSSGDSDEVPFENEPSFDIDALSETAKNDTSFEDDDLAKYDVSSEDNDLTNYDIASETDDILGTVDKNNETGEASNDFDDLVNDKDSAVDDDLTNYDIASETDDILGTVDKNNETGGEASNDFGDFDDLVDDKHSAEDVSDDDFKITENENAQDFIDTSDYGSDAEDTVSGDLSSSITEENFEAPIDDIANESLTDDLKNETFNIEIPSQPSLSHPVPSTPPAPPSPSRPLPPPPKPASPPLAAHPKAKEQDVAQESLSDDVLKDDVKTVLAYMDQLLEALPEEKIEEFARSDKFETYKKVFKVLGLV
jgi:hypothetical protein